MTKNDIEAAKKTITDATEALAGVTAQLKRAKDLLREWKDKYGGREHHAVVGTGDRVLSASPTDLLRDTAKFLEGR